MSMRRETTPDLLLKEGEMPVLKMVLMILVAIYGLSAFFTYLQQKTTAQVAQRAMFDLRENVDKKIQKLPLNYYDTHTHGDVLSRTTTDIETISTSLQQIMTQLLTAIFTIIGIVVMMFTLNWQMALIALVVLPVALFVCSRIAKKSQAFFKGQQEGLGAVNSYVEEHYAGHDVLKLYGGEDRAEHEFDEMNDTLNEDARRAQFASSIMMPATNLVGNLGVRGHLYPRRPPDSGRLAYHRRDPGVPAIYAAVYTAHYPDIQYCQHDAKHPCRGRPRVRVPG